MRFDLNELYKVFDKVVNTGGEGIVCKSVNSSYEFGKRNGNLLKLKAEVEKDLLCIAVEHSIGEMGNSGLSLILTDNNDVRCKVVINSLSLITAINIDETFVVGKVVTVKAMEELSNGVLRQPTFSHIREDVTCFEYCV
jgi:ATP-dependent DNA ligase